ncbi:MAG: type 4a pilus biogenesis protein PilO [Acidobacteria bacterium]|nr:type 4a pilus biogenesis protein PilO [Acidobacteriota bacterium]
MAAFSRIKLSGYIANVPLKQRIALAILLLILVAFGYWRVFLKGAWEERSRARAELFRLKTEAEQTRRIAAQRTQLEQEVKLLEARLNRAVLQLPEEKEIPALLTRVARLGRETDLLVTLFKPGNPVPKEFYTEVPVQVKAVGTYHNLGMLFERLGKMERIVNVADLTIRPAGKDQKAGATIQAEFGLVTYTYTGARGVKGGELAKTRT